MLLQRGVPVTAAIAGPVRCCRCSDAWHGVTFWNILAVVYIYVWTESGGLMRARRREGMTHQRP